MTTTIAPTLGHGPFTQQGVGTTPGYDAIDVRRLITVGALQEGVYGASDFMVVQRAAGANLSVDIGMPAGGFAVIQGDAVTGQGLYPVAVHSGTLNEPITTAHATLPRIDQVILELKDNQHDASGSNLAQTRVVAGTATAGATLNNRTGAAALPASSLLLADVLVAATATSIANTAIRDRRLWARGAYNRIVRSTGSYTIASATVAEIDSTNLKPRIECSGVPLRARLEGYLSSSVASKTAAFHLWTDGAATSPLTERDVITGAASSGYVSIEWEIIPAVGSHTFSPAWASPDGATTISLLNTQGIALFTVEEVVRQNAANNTTTSG